MTQGSGASTPQGYLLLTLNDVRVHRLFDGQAIEVARGELRLECISLPVDPSIGHQRANPFADVSDPTIDLWLVLQVGTYETTLLPTQKITVGTSASGGRTFTIPSDIFSGNNNAAIMLTLPVAANKDDEDDVQTFEVLLKQYGCLPLQEVPEVDGQSAVASESPGDLPALGNKSALFSTSGAPPLPTRSLAPSTEDTKAQGRLVLVDSASGEVVGEIDQTVKVEEDPALSEKGKEQQPVIIDFGDIEYSGVAKTIEVKTVAEEDMDDWMLKGAHYLSKGILGLSGASQSAINAAAEFYIAHSTPNPEPTRFSPATKTGIRQVHNVSAKGYKVTKKTLGMVNDAISKYVGPVADKGFQGAYDFKEAVFGQEQQNSVTEGAALKPKKPFFARLIQAGEVVLTSLEAAGNNLIITSTDAASTAAGHKYGPEAAQATQLLGGSVRNVAIVYVDVRGVGRQALLKRTAKGFVKTTLKSGSKVRLQTQEKGMGGQITMSDGEVVQPTAEIQVEAPTPPKTPGQTTTPATTAQGYPLEKKAT